jgi:hypothetical protein
VLAFSSASNLFYALPFLELYPKMECDIEGAWKECEFEKKCENDF